MQALTMNDVMPNAQSNAQSTACCAAVLACGGVVVCCVLSLKAVVYGCCTMSCSVCRESPEHPKHAINEPWHAQSTADLLKWKELAPAEYKVRQTCSSQSCSIVEKQPL